MAFLEISPQLGQVFLQLQQLLLKAFRRLGDLIDNGHHRLGNAGANDPGGQGQHPQHSYQRQYQRQGTPEPGGRLGPGHQIAFNRPHGHVQDKCDGAPQQEGRKDPQQPAHGAPQGPQILQHPIKGHAAADHCQ